MFFTKSCSCCCHAGGALLFTMGKKLKTKKWLCTIEKIKTKKLKKLCAITNESLRVPGVIDQCSRVDRTCG